MKTGDGGSECQISNVFIANIATGVPFSSYSDVLSHRPRFLKEAVDLIYDCGKYVFCENSARLKGYSSNHLRMKRMRWKRIHNVPVPEPGTEKLSIDI